MEPITTKTRRHGAVTVITTHEYDDDWYSMADHMGRYAAKHGDHYSYHRPSDTVRCPDGTFRDRRGRFAGEPEEDRWSRECEWIVTPEWTENIRQCFADADGLEKYERGDAYMFGIVAKVIVDGVEVAEDSCWAFSSEDTPRHHAYEERNIEGQATARARMWLDKRRGVANQ